MHEEDNSYPGASGSGSRSGQRRHHDHYSTDSGRRSNGLSFQIENGAKERHSQNNPTPERESGKAESKPRRVGGGVAFPRMPIHAALRNRRTSQGNARLQAMAERDSVTQKCHSYSNALERIETGETPKPKQHTGLRRIGTNRRGFKSPRLHQMQQAKPLIFLANFRGFSFLSPQSVDDCRSRQADTA